MTALARTDRLAENWVMRSQLLLVCTLAGCVRLQPPLADDAGPGDTASRREVTSLDGSSREYRTDGAIARAEGAPPVDGVVADATAKNDAASDAARADAPKADVPKPDVAKPDVPKPDAPKPDAAKPDAAKPDVSVADAGAVNACAGGASPVQTYAATMIVCKASATTNQCGAGAFCNASAGWTLCSASQYLARGGKTIAAINRAWLQTCIRDGTAEPPTDALCSSCSTSSGSPLDVGWRCGSGSQSDKKNSNTIGVASFVDCRRVGENSLATEAMWAPYEAASPLDAALCCH